MQINHLTVNHIPLLTCTNEGTEDKKLVVVYYGAYMKKEMVTKLSFVEALVNKGYLVVIPEIPMHGERRNTTIYEPEKDRLNVAVQAGKELSSILQSLGYGNQPCRVIGGSLGSVCGLAATIFNKNIRTVVSYSAPLFWLDFKNSSIDKIGEELLIVDPFNNIEVLASKNILVMTGENDRWAKPEVLQKEVKKIQAISLVYGGNITYKTIPNSGHGLTKEMEDTMLKWILMKDDEVR